MTTINKLVLEAHGSPQMFEGHLSEDTIKDIWEHLLLNTDPPMLKKFWKSSENAEITDDMILFVSTSIKQAHEYFLASKCVSLTTRPLLLYYSVLNLTKAILTVINDQICPSSHGLSNYISSDNLFEISALTRKGVFTTLSKTVQAKWAEDYERKFTLDTFLRNCIELACDYGNYYERTPTIIGVPISRKSDGTVSFTIDKKIVNGYPNFKTILESKPDFKDHFIECDSTESFIIYRNKVIIPEGLENIKKYADPILNK